MRRDNSNGLSLHVSGFKDSTRDLAVLFEPHGRIADVYIPKNYYTGAPRGFAYIQYEDDEVARRVLESGEQFSLDGRRLTLEFAQGRRKSPNQMRHGGRRSGGDRGRGRSRSRSRSRDRRYMPRPRRYSRSRSPSRDRRDRRDRRRDSRSPARRRSRSPTRSRSRSPYRREESRRSPSPRRRGSYRSPSSRRGSYRSPSPRRQASSPRGNSPRQPTINQDQDGYPPAGVEGYTPPRHIPDEPAPFNDDKYV